MFVADFMTAPPRTVTPGTLLPKARELMTTGNFRHLPVVDGVGRLVGIITDRDLRSALPTKLMTESEKEEFLHRFEVLPVGEVMTEAVASLSDQATLDDALLLFDRTRVGALPVLDQEKRVVGILSVRDLLTAYRQLFGLGDKGSTLIGVVDDGQPRMLSRLIETLETAGVPFTRLLRTGQAGNGLVYLRVHTYNLNSVRQALTAAGFASPPPSFERKEKDAG